MNRMKIGIVVKVKNTVVVKVALIVVAMVAFMALLPLRLWIGCSNIFGYCQSED